MEGLNMPLLAAENVLSEHRDQDMTTEVGHTVTEVSSSIAQLVEPDFSVLKEFAEIASSMPYLDVPIDAEQRKTSILYQCAEICEAVEPVSIKTQHCKATNEIKTLGRTSQRACKGAIYKSLVSQGMITYLQANDDRGKRKSGKVGSYEDDDCWTYGNKRQKKK